MPSQHLPLEFVIERLQSEKGVSVDEKVHDDGQRTIRVTRSEVPPILAGSGDLFHTFALNPNQTILHRREVDAMIRRLYLNIDFLDGGVIGSFDNP